MEPTLIIWAVGTLLAIPPWAQIAPGPGHITQIFGFVLLVIGIVLSF